MEQNQHSSPMPSPLLAGIGALLGARGHGQTGSAFRCPLMAGTACWGHRQPSIDQINPDTALSVSRSYVGSQMPPGLGCCRCALLTYPVLCSAQSGQRIQAFIPNSSLNCTIYTVVQVTIKCGPNLFLPLSFIEYYNRFKIGFNLRSWFCSFCWNISSGVDQMNLALNFFLDLVPASTYKPLKPSPFKDPKDKHSAFTVVNVV